MPELPEVETMRRGLAKLVGSRIMGVSRPRSPLRPITIHPGLPALRRAVRARRIVQVGRLGKRVVVWLNSSRAIVIEPRMTGRLLLSTPPDRKHVRLVFRLGGRRKQQLTFWDSRGLGVVHLLRPEEFAENFGPHRLGPDALLITQKMLQIRLRASRRAIKVALMDQRVLAGIGNLYASEILHRAKIHPELPCNRLGPSQWRRLHQAIRRVLREAIRAQGSTLSDGAYGTSDGRAGRFQTAHRVYQRHGHRCPSCQRGTIRRIVQAQRSTFFCPRCQPLGNR